jgi:hypothetical protein
MRPTHEFEGGAWLSNDAANHRWRASSITLEYLKIVVQDDVVVARASPRERQPMGSAGAPG